LADVGPLFLATLFLPHFSEGALNFGAQKIKTPKKRPFPPQRSFSSGCKGASSIFPDARRAVFFFCGGAFFLVNAFFARLFSPPRVEQVSPHSALSFALERDC